MRVEIDQSGKIGNSKQDVVLALAGDIRFTVRLPARVQRAFLQEMRRWGGISKRTYTQLFAVGLYFLLRDRIGQIDLVYIDIEYPGQEAQIRRYLLNYLRRDGITVYKEQIGFDYVGKKSPAHELALATYRGNQPADLVLTLDDILEKF